MHEERYWDIPECIVGIKSRKHQILQNLRGMGAEADSGTRRTGCRCGRGYSKRRKSWRVHVRPGIQATKKVPESPLDTRLNL